MKKRIFILLALLLLVSAAAYIFIPGKISMSGSNIVATTSNGFDTCLHKNGRWRQWWPGNTGNDSDFIYDDYHYRLESPLSDGGVIQARSGKLTLDIRIRTVQQSSDSITAIWQCDLESGNDPFTRIARYTMASRVRKNIQTVLDALYNYAGNTEKLYGFSIKRTTFTEVVLLAKRFITPDYPSNEQIDKAVSELRQYLSNSGAIEKYYPMMNTRRTDSAKYETMIAISIDKPVSANGEYFISRMVPMQDRFLETDIKGGPWQIRQAYNAIEKYMDDHSLSAPARPFEIMVTDRSKEADTAKWVSKLFYPSM